MLKSHLTTHTVHHYFPSKLDLLPYRLDLPLYFSHRATTGTSIMQVQLILPFCNTDLPHEGSLIITWHPPFSLHDHHSAANNTMGHINRPTYILSVAAAQYGVDCPHQCTAGGMARCYPICPDYWSLHYRTGPCDKFVHIVSRKSFLFVLFGSA